MTVISVNNISISFGAEKILDNVSFALNDNDRVGVVGVNGSGKSSLFKIITGEYTADSGNIFIANDKSVGILTQDGAFLDPDIAPSEYAHMTALEYMYTAFPSLTSLERCLEALQADMHNAKDELHSESIAKEYSELHSVFIRDGGLEFRGRAVSTLSAMGYSREAMDLPITALSGGQRTRLALSKQLYREPDILLLDEPTNHLDTDTLVWLENFLSGYKKCVIIISHDRYFLDRITRKTLQIEYGRAKLYNGGYTASMEQRRIDREISEKHYKNQQREIARQEAYIAQQRAWGRERNIIAAESRLKQLEKIERLEMPKDDPRSIRLSFKQNLPSGNEVIIAKNLSMRFGDRTLFENIDFLIRRGERIFITGPNGCGKSTLLKIILGKLRASSGKADFGYNVEPGYYDQENQNLTPSSTVLDELWRVYPSKHEPEIRATLALFRFSYEDTFKTVSVLSGGEKARLTLAKLILSNMNLLIMDEPTNHLDIDSREELERAISEFEGTVIIVSHDRYLINKLATRILALKPSGNIKKDLVDFSPLHTGAAFDELNAYLASENAISSQDNTPISKSVTMSLSKEQYLQSKRSSSDSRKEQRKLERLKKEAAEIEARLDVISAEMEGDAAYDYVRLSALSEERNSIEERLLEIYEEIGI